MNRGTAPGRRLRLGLPSLLLIAAQIGCLSEAATAGLESRIDEFVHTEMRTERVPGVAVGIVMKGNVLLAKGYGEANVELRVPVTRETIFQSGSIGKQFTAVALMFQVEEGRLSLDDSVTKFLPDAPAGWRDITIRHLLTHTSGIPSYATGDIDARRDYSEQDFLKVFYSLPLEFEPGSRWSYSNTGYALLGFIIGRVSGRFYGDVLRDRVFAPLGMRTARIISEADIVPHRAAGYQLVRGELRNQDWIAPTQNTTADGSLYLSMNDYFAWVRGLQAGALLKPESWRAIYTPVTLKSGKTVSYGFGWEVEESRGAPWYHHSGGAQGFATIISRNMADDLSIIVLTNLAEAMPGRFVDGITRIIDPALARLEPDTPIPDRYPEVGERVRALLGKASDGTLSHADLTMVRRDYFPDELDACQALLHEWGQPRQLALVDRRDWGNDVLYSYLASYAHRTLYVQVGLTPDHQISTFEVEPH